MDFLHSLGIGFAEIFGQIVPIRMKTLSNTNLVVSQQIKRERTSLPVDVRRSKTPLLQLHIVPSSSPSKSIILACSLISSVFLPSWTLQKGTACRLVVQDGFVTNLFVSELLPLTSYNTRKGGDASVSSHQTSLVCITFIRW